MGRRTWAGIVAAAALALGATVTSLPAVSDPAPLPTVTAPTASQSMPVCDDDVPFPCLVDEPERTVTDAAGTVHRDCHVILTSAESSRIGCADGWEQDS